MANDDIVWNTDSTNALKIYKYITWTIGTWPLQDEGIFAMIRFGISFVLEFGTLVSVLMEVQLNCGNTDETLDFLGAAASTFSGLMKLIFIKLHRTDLQRIILSALKDWSSIIAISSVKEIMLKYTERGKLVCRVQMGFALIIISAMILDALPKLDLSQSDSGTLNEDILKRIPLRTMCLFGNISTSTYWTVFILQTIQMLNAVFVDTGNDVFFFGIAMHICGQFDSLKIFHNEFKMLDEENRVHKIKEFIERHSHLLNLARLLENTYNNILLVILMTSGLHICLAGIQIMLLYKQNDIVPLVKAVVAFIIILGQLFLYSYVGNYLSSLSQEICQVISNCPWYELPPSIVRNFVFIIMRTHVPLLLTAGRFYPMDMTGFKNILKASFSYFSVLRIAFEE
ncbi:odorant receptor 43a-like [Vespa mandarinia]|uniref:odorant receptor 43a-like n=1 Tax=Vespa mandarinia TaxID=7446 RepID=UPI001616AE70|nr:odorant receptor 43a-like [Vespa mandarinia]